MSTVWVEVVAGMDKPAKLRTLAEEIGGAVYLDDDGEVSRALGRGGVPRWAVVNAKREIVNRGSGLPAITERHPYFETFLKKELKFL